jgi:microcompartment protein CcmK/EutM
MNDNLSNITKVMRLNRIEKIIQFTVLMNAIAPAGTAQPNAFLMIELVQDDGPSAVKSSVACFSNAGASYSDASVSASASKSARASSKKESTRYSYTGSFAAAGGVREVLLRDRHWHSSDAASDWPC